MDFWSQVSERTDNIVLDIGACKGEYTARLLPFAQTVYAIEPNQKNFEDLTNKFENNSIVQLINMAFHSSSGNNKLFIDEGNDGGHTVHEVVVTLGPTKGWGHREDNFVYVKTMTIDQFCQGKNINVIKCDVEGAEDFIFNYGIETLENNTLDILLETHDKDTVDLEALSTFFQDLGYSIYRGDEPVSVMEQNKEYYITNR